MTTTRTSVIPAELRQRRQWVVWRSEQRDGKSTKVLYQPRGDAQRPAKSTDPETWGSYQDATAAADSADGIGFVFTSGDPYAGVDFDHCRDPETGELEPRAALRIMQLDSYTEVSPSGAGIHVLLRGAKPGPRCRTGGIEMYDQARYFSVTGQHLPGQPATINDRQDQISALYAEVFPTANGELASSPSVRSTSGTKGFGASLDDRDLLDRAMRAADGAKFTDLYEGRWEHHYTSQSEADLALCGLLRFWAGQDIDRIDHLFRSSGLYRAKWERADYREATLNKALPGDVFAFSRKVIPTLEPSKPSLLETREGTSTFPGKCDLGEVLAVFDDLLLLPDHGPPIRGYGGRRCELRTR
jgi:putative DNA primase/helicase